MSGSNKDLYNKLNDLLTEQRNSNTMGIDLADSREIAGLINMEDQRVATDVEKKLDQVAVVIDMVADCISKGGRLLYFGAGTSGRLGILDAAECPPTFGTSPEIVQGFIAGGKNAVFKAKEGAEDDPQNGVKDIISAGVNKNDIVIGLAASGRTPYVQGALTEAKKRKAISVLVTTVSAAQVDYEPDIIIDVPVGPEVIMGSTRMKSATAQKMILNMITTGAMIRLGKVYENVMVDLQLTNQKLVERAKRIISYFTGISYDEAGKLLEAAGGHVKAALVMNLKGISKEEAVKLLESEDGFVRAVVEKS